MSFDSQTICDFPKLSENESQVLIEIDDLKNNKLNYEKFDRDPHVNPPLVIALQGLKVPLIWIDFRSLWATQRVVRVLS